MRGSEPEEAGDARGNGLHPDPEERVLCVAGLDDLRLDRPDSVDRYREADADVPAAATLDLRVDADHAALRVEQGAAGVALVQRGVGLDDVVDRVRVRSLDDALERADDPGGDRALEAEGVADRDDRVADADGVRVAEHERRQGARVRVDLQHRDIGGRVDADDPRPLALVVREADVDRARALDHVVVRDDVAGLVDHEAGAERLLLPALRKRQAEERVDRRRVDDLRGSDLDDARCSVAIDLVDRKRLAPLERGRAGRRFDRLELADRRGRLREAAEEGSTPERQRGAESGRRHEAACERNPKPSCHAAFGYSQAMFSARYAALSLR